jgi:hypothetical protein
MTGWLLSNRINNSTGDIEYLNFGCDSDADYGRTIDLFATAVRYSGACARGAGSMMGHGGVGGGAFVCVRIPFSFMYQLHFVTDL